MKSGGGLAIVLAARPITLFQSSKQNSSQSFCLFLYILQFSLYIARFNHLLFSTLLLKFIFFKKEFKVFKARALGKSKTSSKTRTLKVQNQELVDETFTRDTRTTLPHAHRRRLYTFIIVPCEPCSLPTGNLFFLLPAAAAASFM